MLPLKVSVYRQGTEEMVLATELVPGDIVLLKEGDKVPADMYVIHASDVWVNVKVFNQYWNEFYVP